MAPICYFKCLYDPMYLPNNMTIHSRMATKAPVLSPAEDRKACAWQMLLLLRPLFLWHTQTLRESVAVLLRGGSPPSATTSTRLKSSWSLSWLKPSRRRDTILAVLSGNSEDKVDEERIVGWSLVRWMNGIRWRNGRGKKEWFKKGEGDNKTQQVKNVGWLNLF